MSQNWKDIESLFSYRLAIQMSTILNENPES